MKYKLTDETMTTESGVLLHRIECVSSFGNVKSGEKGGWIEKEENISQLGDCWVYGNARVYGDALVYGNAVICNNNDYIVFKNNWSSGRYFTWTRSNDKWIVGCFYGTGKELIEKAYKDSKLSGDCYKAYVELIEKLKQTTNKHLQQ